MNRDSLEHLNRHYPLASEFIEGGWDYDIEILFNKAKGAVKYPQPRSIIIDTKHQNVMVKSYKIEIEKNDRRRFGELIFLLAAKLKLDTISEQDSDVVGFLHSSDIIKLNASQITKVQKSLDASLNRLYNNALENSGEKQFLENFFDSPSQIRHLIYSMGQTGPTSIKQNILWRLNVKAENIEFKDNKGVELTDAQLCKQLSKLFPKEFLLGKKEVLEIISSYDNNIKAKKNKNFPNKIKQYDLNDRIESNENLSELLINKYQKILNKVISCGETHIPLEYSIVNGHDFYSEFSNSNYSPTKPLIKTGNEKYELSKVVKNNSNLLLTGDSGSGKTTDLRKFIEVCLSDKETSYYFFYLDLEDANYFLSKKLKRDNEVAISDLFSHIIATTMVNKVELSELIHEIDLNKSRGYKNISKKNVYDLLSSNIKKWFEEQGFCNHKVILVIDDFNKLNSFVRKKILKSLNDILSKPCKIILTCQNNIKSDISKQLEYNIKEYCILEVSDEDIISYLDIKTSQNGRLVFEEKIKSDASLYQIAKNPFFLDLISNQIQSKENISFVNRAKLIERFVETKLSDSYIEQNAQKVGINKNLIRVILPMVAKYNLDNLGSIGKLRFKPFYYTNHFKYINEPSDDIFKALEISQVCGLLKTTGLVESSEYPTFTHDCLRDYFASQYLLNCENEELFNLLEKNIEYFVWDEAVLQLLELCHDVELFKRIVEKIANYDLGFAALCIKYSKILEDSFVLDFGNRLLKQKAFEKNCNFIKYNRNLSQSPLIEIWSRVSFLRLLNYIKENEGDFGHWVALGNVANDINIPLIKNLKNVLDLNETAKGIYVLLALTRINTLKGFNAAMDMYKDMCNYIDTEDLFLMLLYATYRPTLKELEEVFPPEIYPLEFSSLLPKIIKIESQDLNVLSKLIFSKKYREIYAIQACELLVRYKAQKSLDILVKKYKELSENWHFSEFDLFQNKKKLIELISEICPSKAVDLLVKELQNEFGYRNDYDFWKLLTSLTSEKKLDHIIKYAYTGSLPSSHLCIDYLCDFHDKKKILASLHSILGEGEQASDRAKLLGAAIGDEKLFDETLMMFENIYSVLIDSKIPPVPEISESIKCLPTDKQKRYSWTKSKWLKHNRVLSINQLYLLVRTLPKNVRIDIYDKLINLVKWSYPYIFNKKESPNNEKNQVVFLEILSSSLKAVLEIKDFTIRAFFIDKLIKQIDWNDFLNLIIDYGKSNDFRGDNDIIIFQQKKNRKYMISRLVDVFIDFMQAIPLEDIDEIIRAFQQTCYNLNLNQSNSFTKEQFSKIIIKVTQRIGEKKLFSFINYLNTIKNNDSCNFIESLIDDVEAETGIRLSRF